MKSIIVLMMLISSVSFADKQADKDRTDRCFKILNSMVQETNSAQFSGNVNRRVILQNNFNSRKAGCIASKQAYEKQYGKYEMPSANVSMKELRELKHQEMGEVMCLLKANLTAAKAKSSYAGFKAQQLYNEADAEYVQMFFGSFNGKCS